MFLSTSVIRILLVYHLSLQNPTLFMFWPRDKMKIDWTLNAAPAAVPQVFERVWLNSAVLIAASSENWQDFQQNPSFLLKQGTQTA